MEKRYKVIITTRFRSDCRGNLSSTEKEEYDFVAKNNQQVEKKAKEIFLRYGLPDYSSYEVKKLE